MCVHIICSRVRLSSLQPNGSQSMFPSPAASVSPGNFLEIQILRPYPRATKSETLGWGSAICILTSPGSC